MSGGEFDWRMIGALAAFAVSWSGVLLWAVKWLNDRQQAHIDTQFADLAKSRDKDEKAAAEQRKKDANELARIEREFMALRAELPLHYVRREDHIRSSAVIEAKQDRDGERLVNLTTAVGRLSERLDQALKLKGEKL